MAQLQEGCLVLVRKASEQMDVSQLTAMDVLLQGGSERAASDKDDGILTARQGLKQGMQALVVTQGTNEQKEWTGELSLPVIQPLRIGSGITGWIDADGNDAGFVGVLCQNRAGGKIVGGGGDNMIDASKEAVHQGAVEPGQVFLFDDVGVIGKQRRFFQLAAEVHQIHEWPGEVVMDKVGMRGEVPEVTKGMK